MLCIWEKTIIPEIKKANIVITELYKRIHYLSKLLDQQGNLILLHLQYKVNLIEITKLFNESLSFIKKINIHIRKLDYLFNSCMINSTRKKVLFR
ncbi:hypothetical protein AY608_11990 [Acinetobacter terrae]|nr:hypothetical protein AY608_11990 [Acinetobacter terrae]OTG75333.1 hypothetical protein B9T23_11150 [Acinetobacter terrae]